METVRHFIAKDGLASYEGIDFATGERLETVGEAVVAAGGNSERGPYCDCAAESCNVPTRTCGRSIGPLTRPARLVTVKVEVICAVKNEIRTTAANIRMPASIRPNCVRGALSPYPTDVIVTAAHHRPSAMPLSGRSLNCSGLARRSNIQTSEPAIINTKTNRPMILRNDHETRLPTTATESGAADAAGTAMPRPVL